MKFHQLVAACAAAAAVTAAAQGYPTKTVKIVAPVQPGGGVDLVAHTGGALWQGPGPVQFGTYIKEDFAPLEQARQRAQHPARRLRIDPE